MAGGDSCERLHDATREHLLLRASPPSWPPALPMLGAPRYPPFAPPLPPFPVTRGPVTCSRAGRAGEVGGDLGHAPGFARGADPAALAGEGDQALVAAFVPPLRPQPDAPTPRDRIYNEVERHENMEDRHGGLRRGPVRRRRLPRLRRDAGRRRRARPRCGALRPERRGNAWLRRLRARRSRPCRAQLRCGGRRHARVCGGRLTPWARLEQSSLVWRYPDGRSVPAIDGTGYFEAPRLSPEGTRLAVASYSASGTTTWSGARGPGSPCRAPGTPGARVT